MKTIDKVKKVLSYTKKTSKVVNKIALIKSVRALNIVRDNPDNSTSLRGALDFVDKHFWIDGTIKQ